MSRVAVLNRIATRAIQQIILMMNNTRLLNKPNAVVYIDDVFVYLTGNHHDVGLSGDRGDFYRRKLAEQIFLTVPYKVLIIVMWLLWLEQRLTWRRLRDSPWLENFLMSQSRSIM